MPSQWSMANLCTYRDYEGHGTHAASIAYGNEVKDASFFGVGQSTARGGVSLVRVAAYKVCSPAGCTKLYFFVAIKIGVLALGEKEMATFLFSALEQL
ncbi:hypothetical protein CUMW_231680 [Citrus unshiu]|uniref:Peptidase S8/S53 domain-containing protein n=1 Tax=Citrus unshiu TaxID=55188 RepID=A0A2H5QHU0_CITUN|nr:hypothetical protein CUMW_231680 [Citrus unshiu]